MKVGVAPEPVAGPRGATGQRVFEAMADQSRRRAYALALHLTRNASDAEDLVQKTYVKAWNGFASYMPDRSFLNWLLRIMQRAYLDSRRRENPIRKAESLNSMISPQDGEVRELPIPDPAEGPAERAIRSEYALELRAALRELPGLYRTAIELADLDGMSYAEIAEAQNTTIGTVRSRIHRGRKLLREIVLGRGLARMP
jgi:RNA polymerase sigma-70 factor (ECF subfamily)